MIYRQEKEHQISRKLITYTEHLSQKASKMCFIVDI